MHRRELPHLSSELSQKRLEKANSLLGAGVVARILAFALYLLGANRSALAQYVGLPLDTLKSLLQRMLKDGLPALEDRRRKSSTFLPHAPVPQPEPKLVIGEDTLVVHLDPERKITMPRHNPIQCRAVLLTMLDARLLGLEEVADGIGLSTERARKLKAKLLENDLDALIDQRRGQQRDYRVTPEVKAEIIQQYILNLQTNAGTSAEQLRDDLDERCQIKLAPRTIGLHVAKLALQRIRGSLPELLATLKKTEKDDRGGSPPVGFRQE